MAPMNKRISRFQLFRKETALLLDKLAIRTERVVVFVIVVPIRVVADVVRPRFPIDPNLW